MTNCHLAEMNFSTKRDCGGGVYSHSSNGPCHVLLLIQGWILPKNYDIFAAHPFFFSKMIFYPYPKYRENFPFYTAFTLLPPYIRFFSINHHIFSPTTSLEFLLTS